MSENNPAESAPNSEISSVAAGISTDSSSAPAIKRPTKMELKDKKAELEADMAYFEARLELIGGEPDTTNKLAQQVTFRVLADEISKKIRTVESVLPKKKS